MTYPTAYPEVNAVVDELLARVKDILRHNLVGMYLCGSLALDDFVPHRSDVDIVVVTGAMLSEDTFAALSAMHTRFAGSGLALAKVLEGSYVPLRDLRSYDPASAVYPRVDCGKTLRVEHGSWWVIDRYVLREHGISVVGPSPATLCPPVARSELGVATAHLLREHWAPMLDEPARLRDPGYRVYAVLTMCRILYTLRHGTVVSKSMAAAWAQHILPGNMASLVARALDWRDGNPFDNMNETTGLIRYVLEHVYPDRSVER